MKMKHVSIAAALITFGFWGFILVLFVTLDSGEEEYQKMVFAEWCEKRYPGRPHTTALCVENSLRKWREDN